MLTRILTVLALAAGAALMFQPAAGAQRGGGGGGGEAPRFPTKQQFEASAEAQKIVAEVRARVGADLQKEFENTCSATGPQRAALARQAEGLPPAKDFTVEPTKIFDNMWEVGLASKSTTFKSPPCTCISPL